MKTTCLFLMITILSLVFPGASLARQIRDQIDNTVSLPDNPQKVISLAPALTEIVFALGEESRLTGATRFSDFPVAAKNIPRVGTYVRPDLEKIVALAPDLCLATKDGNPKEAVEKIISFDIPVFTVDPHNIEEVRQLVLLLGRVLNADEKAQSIANDMQSRLHKITRLMQNITSRPKVFFQIDVSPIVSAGSGTFIDELITLAGGINLASGPNKYPRFNWEQLLLLQPDIVVITSMAGEHTGDELRNRWRRFPTIPAVKNNRVLVVDANLFGRPTPRLIEGLEMLTAIIHPQISQKNNE